MTSFVVATPQWANSVWPAWGWINLPFSVVPLTRIHGRVYVPALGDRERPIPELNLSYAKIELRTRKLSTDPWLATGQETCSSKNGEFEFQADVSRGDEVSVTAYLETKYNEKKYFKVIDFRNSRYVQNVVEPTVSFSRNLTILESEVSNRKEINLVLTGALSPVEYSSESGLDRIENLSSLYQMSYQAVRFALDKLGADITQFRGTSVLPIKVVANYRGSKETSTELKIYPDLPPKITIRIEEKYVNDVAPVSLVDTIFHEWGHAFIDTQFNFEEALPRRNVNHGGFLNANTADSLFEAEASFLSMLMSREYRYLPRNDHPTYGDLGIEPTWFPWDMRGDGSHEETAVISLLWDLYDDTPQERFDRQIVGSDNVKIADLGGLPGLWNIIRNSNTNTTFDLYQALIQTHPNKRSGIDQIFVEHGFYNDTDVGDGRYNGPIGEGPNKAFWGEPYRNSITSFEDLGFGHRQPYGQVYNQGLDAIGYASNYRRPNRKVRPPQNHSFIRIENPEVHACVISIKFEQGCEYFDYQLETMVLDGLLYFNMPSSCYDTVATVTPKSNSFTADPLVINLTEYITMLSRAGSDEQEYFFTHKFNLKSSTFFGLSVSPELLCLVLIIVAVVPIAGAIALIARRKHKNPEKNTLPTPDTQTRTNLQPLPPPPPSLSPSCPTCGSSMRYIQQYQRWYCDKEKKYG
jgi:hypothetical protein